MLHEEAHPPGGMNCILVRMIAGLGDQMWNVMDRDDAVKQREDHQEQESEGEIVQERIAYHIAFSYGP
jgi:hypothetical protein